MLSVEALGRGEGALHVSLLLEGTGLDLSRKSEKVSQNAERSNSPQSQNPCSSAYLTLQDLR